MVPKRLPAALVGQQAVWRRIFAVTPDATIVWEYVK